MTTSEPEDVTILTGALLPTNTLLLREEEWAALRVLLGPDDDHWHDRIVGLTSLEAQLAELREAHRNESAGLDNWRNRAERAEAALTVERIAEALDRLKSRSGGPALWTATDSKAFARRFLAALDAPADVAPEGA